jgi:hypothetical protein
MVWIVKRWQLRWVDWVNLFLNCEFLVLNLKLNIKNYELSFCFSLITYHLYSLLPSRKRRIFDLRPPTSNSAAPASNLQQPKAHPPTAQRLPPTSNGAAPAYSSAFSVT